MDSIIEMNKETGEVVWFKDYLEDYYNQTDPIIKETMKEVIIRKLPSVNRDRKEYNLPIIDQEELLNFNPIQEFKVEAIISVRAKSFFHEAISLDEVNDALIAFVESKGWLFGGKIKLREKDDETI